MGTPAKCLPVSLNLNLVAILLLNALQSSTALGATWDTKLIEEVGLKLLAPEAKLRAASVILAPTCNIQRSPLGGRVRRHFAPSKF
jgi:beta-glucosidase